MKVVHVPFTFAPDPVGGTEIYVEALAHGLRAHGIESCIAAPSAKGNNQVYEHRDLRVHRFRWGSKGEDMLRQLYGGGDPEAALAFANILDEECPAAVHIHAFTSAVSLRLVRAAKQRGIPVVFTYHTATASCLRGTLLLWGKKMCDGVLDVRRCGSCSLEGRGLPRWAAGLFSYGSLGLARRLENASLSGGIWTALRTPELVRAHHQAFYALMREVDAIIALSAWSYALLLRNGAPREKVTLLQHWLPQPQTTEVPPIGVFERPLRIAFLGRGDKAKGADVLIRAVRAAPELDVALDLYVVRQGADDERSWTLLKVLAAEDPRIKFLSPVSNSEVVSLLRAYHVLTMPAQGVENRPLVILESFTAGTPVIGSNLGGVAELVQHSRDGLLVEATDVQAWADALRRCAEDRTLLAQLREGVQSPRHSVDAAAEMARLYRTLHNRGCSRAVRVPSGNLCDRATNEIN